MEGEKIVRCKWKRKEERINKRRRRWDGQRKWRETRNYCVIRWSTIWPGVNGQKHHHHHHHLFRSSKYRMQFHNFQSCRAGQQGWHRAPTPITARSLDQSTIKRSIWKMLVPFATASRFTLPFTRCRYCPTPPLSHAACASMSTTTTTTTTTRDRGDRYGPMEWAQWRHSIRY